MTTGTSGNDTMFGGSGNDSIWGQAGNDSLVGNDGSDQLYGETGNDSAYGGNGDDALSGGKGNDVLDGGSGVDNIVGGQGNDTAYGGNNNDVILGDGQWLTQSNYFSAVFGTNTTLTVMNSAEGPIYLHWIDTFGNPQLIATIAAGQSFSFATHTGNNYILKDEQGYFLEPITGALNQTVNYGPDMDDVLYGGANDDSILGQYGDDTIFGDDGNDTISGGTGNDSISGGAGTDSIQSGVGNDSVFGGSGNDTVTLGDGNDSFGSWSSDEAGDDTIDGGLGNDSIIAGAGNDVVYGGDGNDVLSGGGGNDTLYGGIGNDTFAITDDHQGDTIFGGENAGDYDLVAFGNYASTQGVVVTFTGAEAGTYNFASGGASGRFSEIEGISGTAYNDTINAGAASSSEQLFGGAGTDVITGGSGSDTIYLGSGNDTAYGGGGNDLIDDSNGAIETGNKYIDSGSGNDTVWSGDGQDTLNGGSGDDRLMGEGGNDSFVGAAGNDTLYGDAGADTISNGAGNDFVYGGADNDTVIVAAGDGNDVLYGGENSGDGDVLRFTGATTSGVNITYTGNEAGTYSFTGASGSFSEIEQVQGSELGDTINASAASSGVNIDGMAGNDAITGGTGANALSGGDGDDSIYGGAGADSLYGGAGNDLAFGGDGNDLLAGDGGNDRLSGGAGSDTLSGGAGRDVFDFDHSGGGDLITDFDMSLASGTTADQLDVSDLQNVDGSPVSVWDVVVGDDGTGRAVLTFPGGESVVLSGVSPAQVMQSGMLHAMGVPCFAGGTRILTPQGERKVEQIAVGDLVVTAAGQVVPVLWRGQRVVNDLADKPSQQPIRLAAGGFGNRRDLIVSPQHGVHLPRCGDVLIRAGNLVGLDPRARVAKGMREVTYYHLLLPKHALLVAEGAFAESFYPGAIGVAALDNADRHSLRRAILAQVTADLGPAAGSQNLATLYGPRCMPLLRRKEAVICLTDRLRKSQVILGSLPQRGDLQSGNRLALSSHNSGYAAF
jgi:Ca2+-binding RTX toxin-like protein